MWDSKNILIFLLLFTKFLNYYLHTKLILKGATVFKYFLALFIPASLAYAEAGWRAVDGDTIKHQDTGYIRLLGVDTPEKRCRCPSECSGAIRAQKFVQEQLDKATRVGVVGTTSDKYGRLLADVYVDGVNLNKMILDKNLGRPYSGGKRDTWCHA